MKISCRQYPSEVSFRLPPSKSILARMVLLHLVEEVAYGRVFSFDTYFIDDPSDDVAVMLRFADYFHSAILSSDDRTPLAFDCGESGTALRFITAFCAALPIRIKITAQGHLKNRPMSELLQVLEGWGASFDYLGDSPYSIPLVIHGGHLRAADVSDTGKWRSSQFVSALILTSPLMRSNFSILRSFKSPSSEYIRLTISVMRSFGYDVSWDSNKIEIMAKEPEAPIMPLAVEADWSSASYWYQLMLLHPEIERCSIIGLRMDSAQPDAVMMDVFASLGIYTGPITEGICLARIKHKTANLQFDCAQSPDLFPALFCAAIGVGIPFTFTGTQLLRFKESDRIHAMLEGAAALGYVGFTVTDDSISWTGGQPKHVANASVHGYADHRVVMSFAVLATALSTTVSIDDTIAVAKSFPSFFSELGPHD